MIQGINRNTDENSYRNVMLDSSSSLKDFSFDRKKYYKRYILNEFVEEKDTQASVMGKIVETLLLEPEKFDNKFHLSACVNSPTGLMDAFIEALYGENLKAMDEEGNITKSFEEMSKEAYLASGFKIKYEAVLNKFIGSDAEIYYNEIRQVRAKNLIVITANDIANGERIVEELKTNFVTKDIVNLVDSERWIVRNQFQIEGFEIDSHLFKSMIDKVIADCKEKTIQPLDLKCTWNVEDFYENYFLYRRAYLQAYIYYRAIKSLVENENSEYYGYTVLPTSFIVCDSINYYNPLIYTLTENDLDDAYTGFVYKGKDYPGVGTIIENLKWAIDQNIWNMSRENYINNGIAKLNKNV